MTMSRKRRYDEVQLQLFTLAQEQKQLQQKAAQMELKLTALKLLVRRLGIALIKRCPKCKLELSAEHFYRDARYTDGLHSWCKECKRIYNASKKKAA